MRAERDEDQWWNDVAARAAARELSVLQRLLWWLWRAWNWLRPAGLFGRLWGVMIGAFFAWVTVDAGWLEMPGKRIGGCLVLAGALLTLYVALGPRRVRIRRPASRRKRAETSVGHRSAESPATLTIDGQLYVRADAWPDEQAP